MNSSMGYHFVAAAMWYTKQSSSTHNCRTVAICGGSSLLVYFTSTPMKLGYKPPPFILSLLITSSALSGSLVQMISSVSLPWNSTLVRVLVYSSSRRGRERRRGCYSCQTCRHDDAWQTVPPPSPSFGDCGLGREKFVVCVQLRWKRQWWFL